MEISEQSVVIRLQQKEHLGKVKNEPIVQNENMCDVTSLKIYSVITSKVYWFPTIIIIEVDRIDMTMCIKQV